MCQMTKKEFEVFMDAQIKAIREDEVEAINIDKWLEGEKRCCDPGEQFVMEWIKNNENNFVIGWINKHGKDFRQKWIKKFSENFKDKFFKGE